MSEDQALDECLGDLLLFRGELGDGFELKAQILIGSALILVEYQEIGGAVQAQGELAQGVQRGLGLTVLIALNLVGMHAARFGEGLLGEPTFLAQGQQSFCKRHRTPCVY